MRLSVPGNARPSRLRGAPLETPIGLLWITLSDDGVYEISRALARGVPEPGAVAEAAGQLDDYFAGRRRTFDFWSSTSSTLLPALTRL